MTESNVFDVVIIGGGPGGYVAAIKAGQLGLKVACVEKRGRLGGTCLNVGCIPSKSLLNSSHKYEEASKHMADHGIEIASVKLNLAKMMERKNNVISSLGGGIEMLFKKNKVSYLIGEGSFKSANEITVKTKDGEQVLTTKNTIIATGSDIMRIPNIEIDEKVIVSSTGALELEKVPGSMLVIGGGVIGLEMGSVWSRLGAKVTVVEYGDAIISTMDADVSKEFKKILEKQGLSFKLSTKVVSAQKGKKGVDVSFESVADKSVTNENFDVVLVCIGRKAYTDGLNLAAVNLQTDPRGKIQVSANFETAVKGVYAIGDVIDGPMLAHKAEEEGVAAVEIIAGQHGHVNYAAIPGIVYTHPEVASVGKTEKEAKEAGIDYAVGKFPFLANSRAKTNGETDGFVKIITNKQTDEIIGAQIIGSNAGELIQEIVLGMEFKAAAEDIARTSHGHPGLSEAVKEAAMAAYFKPIHM
ncbi:MAG: dihydrolipoyl dehydrogenase [Alphaproteobacteria bacterium]|jgi:dihydrolipoamide dehydrogenase|nr:dihydrolipoyl dehydrogenase [Candidatus Jidaibacter sp.]